MPNLKALGERLARRMDVNYQDGELSLVCEGEPIHVYDDSAHDRLTVWAEIADIPTWDLPAAAKAALIVNDRLAFKTATTLAVSTSASKALLGRSFERENPDAEGLFAEIRDFRSKMQEVRLLFQTECGRAARNKPSTPSFVEPAGAIRL